MFEKIIRSLSNQGPDSGDGQIDYDYQVAQTSRSFRELDDLISGERA